MDINRLAQDELEYLLRIHGSLGGGTVDDMRRTLRGLRRAALSASFVFPKHPYTFAEDVAAIRTKLEEVSVRVDGFSDTRQSAAYRKLATKLAYLTERINRSVANGDEEIAERTALLVRVVEMNAKLSAKAKAYRRASTAVDASVLDLSMMNQTSESGSGSSSDSDSDIAAPVVPVATVAQMAPAPKSVPVSSWGVKFSGSPKELSLSAFLERVNELKVARHSSNEMLFQSAVDLFTGNALIWYRANRSSFTCWSDLVAGLRLDFQTPSYDDSLFSEIRQRTQGRDESMGLYVSIMSNLFSRLSVRVSEAARLKIILKNIHPFYQSQLGLVDITSLEQLRQFGRRLEAQRSRIEAFVPPPNRSRVMEPDLAYLGGPSTHHVSAVESAAHSTDAKCWNCGRTGHRFVQCNSVRRRFCFRCGRPNVTRTTCPKCSGNGHPAQ